MRRNIKSTTTIFGEIKGDQFHFHCSAEFLLSSVFLTIGESSTVDVANATNDLVSGNQVIFEGQINSSEISLDDNDHELATINPYGITPTHNTNSLLRSVMNLCNERDPVIDEDFQDDDDDDDEYESQWNSLSIAAINIRKAEFNAILKIID